MNRMHPHDLRAIMAAIIHGPIQESPSVVVEATDYLTGQLERTAKPVPGWNGRRWTLPPSPGLEPPRPAQVAGWEIDTTSTPNPILTYDKCSVIQDEQAFEAINAIKRAPDLEAQVDRLKAALDEEALARKAAADGLADAKAEVDLWFRRSQEHADEAREKHLRLAAIDAARQGEPPMPKAEQFANRMEEVLALRPWGRQGWDAAAALRVERDKLVDLVRRLGNAAGMSSPWPVPSVLHTLARGVEHLLNDHGCDGHGHEALAHAADAARAAAAEFAQALAAASVWIAAEPDPAIHAEDLVEALDDDPEPRDGFHDGHDTFEERDGER